MKRYVFLTLFLLIFTVNESNGNPSYITIGRKNYILTFTRGWRRTARIWPDMITFSRGREYSGFRLHQVGENFEKYLTEELYTLKRIERKIYSEKKVHIEGIEFNEITSERIIANTIQYQINLIALKNALAIHFRYFTYDLNTFKRNIDEFKINISRFLRQNFLQ